MSLTFNPEKHQYFWNGKPVPSVSEILEKTKLGKDYSGVDPFYKDRGIAVHMAIQFYLTGVLDETSLDPVCVPYFEGAKKFLLTLKKPPSVMNIEEKLYSQRLGFAGTLDLVADDMIWDWKCSKSPDPVSELQGAAYQMLWGENFGIEIPFRVVQLVGDGTYKIIDYKTTDPNLWDSVMGLYRWKTKGKK